MSSTREQFRGLLTRPGCTLAANIFDPLSDQQASSELLRAVNRTEEFIQLQQTFMHRD